MGDIATHALNDRGDRICRFALHDVRCWLANNGCGVNLVVYAKKESRACCEAAYGDKGQNCSADHDFVLLKR
jgi:hypothetical protein